MANIEERMSTAEHTLGEHGKQIEALTNDYKCVKTDCTAEKVMMGKLDEKFVSLAAQLTLIAKTNTDAMTLIKWVITVLAVIIVALLGVLGVKVALPSMGV